MECLKDRGLGLLKLITWGNLENFLGNIFVPGFVQGGETNNIRHLWII